MSDQNKPMKDHHRIGLSGAYVAVPALLVAALWFYVQLLQWRRHGDDFMLTVADIIITLALWAFAIIFVVRVKRTRKALEQAQPLRTSAISKLTIHSAVYGTGADTDIDVTDKVISMVQDGLVIPVANDLAPRDPHFGTVKRLLVEYSYGNFCRVRVTRPENTRLVLPEDTWVRDELAKYLDVAVKESDPHIYAEFCDDRGATPNKESQAYITLFNRGGSDALNVCIEPIRLSDHVINFPRLAYIIERGKAKHRYPDVTTTDNRTPHHIDVFSHIAHEYMTVHELSVPEMTLPLAVSYQDSAHNLYQACCELVFDPSAHGRVRTQGQNGSFVVLKTRNHQFKKLALAVNKS